MSTHITPQTPTAPVIELPVEPIVDSQVELIVDDEEWTEDEEQRFDEMLTHLYYSGHSDQEFWV